ncbi:MAG: UDP-N-acetylmuramoyl-L-alanine--D-glutamate ligase [Clostridiales bacterium]|nr:UDP-N-acetylmuramoyl-L-alanine--D-glutamate ligase [Clostridiales bacterium]
MYQQLIDYYSNRSVLILGFGREGRSTYEFIRKYLPEKDLTIADKNKIEIDDNNVTLICGENYLDCVNNFDLVMKSPGISFKDVKVDENTEVTCQTDLFLRFSDCKAIGITGTKGKTTTSSLIYSVLKEAGFNTCLIGNIGVPVFENLIGAEKLTAVIEMSSHQLEFTRKSPHIAVLTNVYPEHLDHYNGFEGYVNAKLNIVRNQSVDDFFVYCPDQDISQYIDFKEIKSDITPVSYKKTSHSDFFNELFNSNEHLKGEHNKQDILFAYSVAKILGVSDEDILKGIKAFQGIPHRMEYVGTFKDIKFYNDCIATIPHAVICAVEALEDVDTLIIGGMDRGLDYSEFEQDLAKSKISNLICLPETGHNIADNLKKIENSLKIYKAKDLPDAVEKAYEVTQKGMTCLLSPAASSYNYYKNFEEKGTHYKNLVKQLGEK